MFLRRLPGYGSQMSDPRILTPDKGVPDPGSARSS